MGISSPVNCECRPRMSVSMRAKVAAHNATFMILEQVMDGEIEKIPYWINPHAPFRLQQPTDKHAYNVDLQNYSINIYLKKKAPDTA